MKILIDESFYKDWKKIKDQDLNQKVLSFIEEIQKAESLSSLSNLKKLVGTKSYFRAKLGNYRVGLLWENDHLIFIRILHRKDIYRFFP